MVVLDSGVGILLKFFSVQISREAEVCETKVYLNFYLGLE